MAACAGSPGDDPEGGGGKADDPGAGLAAVDVVATDLSIDLGTRRGRARIEFGAGAATLEVGGLQIDAVAGEDGALDFEVIDGRLEVPEFKGRLVIDYRFSVHDKADGLLANGSTLLWPYFCGNVFPCHSAPADGQQFTLALAGVPAGQTAVFSPAITADAPSYQLAWAVGEYTFQELGTTPAGTRVGVYWLPRGKTRALAGTRHLVAAFDWLERTIGPYLFGDEVAAVSVDWNGGAFGGMEHHPQWHVSADAMDDELTQVHEAAHGWFGDGVRLRCWEDFVLSEGTVSYLAARAIGQAVSAEAEAEIWRGYRADLRAAVKEEQTVARPEGCGAIDIIGDGLFSEIPYMKGAFFYKAVAVKVGADVLDGVIARFYGEHAGKAAGMKDMLDAIRTDTGFDPSPLARTWLEKKGLPTTIP